MRYLTPKRAAAIISRAAFNSDLSIDHVATSDEVRGYGSVRTSYAMLRATLRHDRATMVANMVEAIAGNGRSQKQNEARFRAMSTPVLRMIYADAFYACLAEVVEDDHQEALCDDAKRARTREAAESTPRALRITVPQCILGHISCADHPGRMIPYATLRLQHPTPDGIGVASITWQLCLPGEQPQTGLLRYADFANSIVAQDAMRTAWQLAGISVTIVDPLA